MSKNFNLSQHKPSKPNKKEHNKGHNPFTYILILIILVIVVVTFVSFPLSSIFFKPPKTHFGSYQSSQIDYKPGSLFSNNLQNNYNYMQTKGIDFSKTPFFVNYLWNQAFQQTAFQTALAQLAQDYHYRISDTMLVDYFHNMPMFKNQNGQFDADLYAHLSLIDRKNLSINSKTLLLSGQLEYDLIHSVADTGFLKTLNQQFAPSKKIQYLSFGIDDVPTKQLTLMVKGLDQQFTKLTYQAITIPIDKKNDQKAQQMMSVPLKEQTGLALATSLYGKLKKAPQDFKKLGDTYAQGISDPVTKSYFQLKDQYFSDKQLKQIMSLGSHSISPVLTINDQYWIIKPIKIQKYSVNNPLILPQIKIYLQTHQALALSKAIDQQATDFVRQANRLGWSLAQKRWHKSSQSTKYFGLNYKNSQFFPSIAQACSAKDWSTLIGSSAFFKTVFALPLKKISEPTSVNNLFYVFLVTASKNQTSFDSTGQKNQINQQTLMDISKNILQPPYFKNHFEQVYRQYYQPKPKPMNLPAQNKLAGSNKKDTATSHQKNHS